MALYDVFLRGKKIDMVYRKGDHDESDKVRRSLVLLGCGCSISKGSTVTSEFRVIPSHLIAWQRTLRNRLFPILAECLGTLRAYYDAIVSYFTPLFKGYAWYGEMVYALGTPQAFATPSTPPSKLILLPSLRGKNSHVSESHYRVLPSTYDWELNGLGHYVLYHGEKEAEMWIVPRYRLWVLDTVLRLKHPLFHIHFFVGDAHISVADMPNLREAKELAESYYSLWLKVKDDPKQTEMYAELLKSA